MEEKLLYCANFNVTFGDEELPMLEFFEEIIYPAFKSGFIRGKEDVLPYYFFDNIVLKMHENNRAILCGNLIKNTELRRKTILKDGQITSSPHIMESSPYSRFVIFLDNHRLILVKNESDSPDTRSFEATAKEVISKYIRKENRRRKQENQKSEDLRKELLPKASVRVIDTPSEDEIKKMVGEAYKIAYLKLSFFPLNNDDDPSGLFENLRKEAESLGSKTGNVTFNSPRSKEEVIKVLDATNGLADPNLRIRDENKNERNISKKDFKTQERIPLAKDLSEENDTYIIENGLKNPKMGILSEANKKLYLRKISILSSLIDNQNKQ